MASANKYLKNILNFSGSKQPAQQNDLCSPQSAKPAEIEPLQSTQKIEFNSDRRPPVVSRKIPNKNSKATNIDNANQGYVIRPPISAQQQGSSFAEKVVNSINMRRKVFFNNNSSAVGSSYNPTSGDMSSGQVSVEINATNIIKDGNLVENGYQSMTHGMPKKSKQPKSYLSAKNRQSQQMQQNNRRN